MGSPTAVGRRFRMGRCGRMAAMARIVFLFLFLGGVQALGAESQARKRRDTEGLKRFESIHDRDMGVFYFRRQSGASLQIRFS